MARKEWEPIKISFCHHKGQEVTLEAEVIYPSDIMPFQQPRIVAHRCSKALECNLEGKGSCIWAGTNPMIDPFLEKTQE
jgi:hypothetical protein